MSLSRLKHSSTGSSIPVARPEVCQHSAQLYLLSSCCNCCFIFGCALCPHRQCKVGVVFRQVSSNSDQCPAPLTTVIAVNVVLGLRPCSCRSLTRHVCSPFSLPCSNSRKLNDVVGRSCAPAVDADAEGQARGRGRSGACGYRSVDRLQ